MSKLNILTVEKSTAELHQKAQKVTDPQSPEIQVLIDEMIITMRQAEGIGLAATQIGKPLQLCVLEINGQIYVMINPKITSSGQEVGIMEEGCLSIPDEYYAIERPDKIQVRYIDRNGNKCKLRASGLLSRAIQHELDHLNGVLIIDRVSATRSWIPKKGSEKARRMKI